MKPNYRQLMFSAFAKLGSENQAQLMGYYDVLAPRFGEEQAIGLIHEAFVQLQEATSATASAGYKNLLTETARKLWDALDGKTITVKGKSAMENFRESMRRIEALKKAALEGKELDVEIGGKLRLGVIETKEALSDSGMLERKRIYKSVASEGKIPFELTVRF